MTATLALVTDAFGGRGGIAQFSRDLLTALCGEPGAAVTVLPRNIVEEIGQHPAQVRFVSSAARGKVAFVREALRETRQATFDVIVCGHLNLLPLGVAIALLTRKPLLLVIYGIEAWSPASFVTRALLRRVDQVVAISEFTRTRFHAWANVPRERSRVIPCCVDASKFGPGPRRTDLVERYGLQGRTVLMTMARLAGAERYKGFDEVLEVLPRLADTMPSITYVIAGEGLDRERLERKANALEIGHRVIFTGYVDDGEKADHYRLADLFVMPGRGEGFGIVYLEAMASGVRVVASSADASRETVLDGLAGEVVNPDDPDDIYAGILRGLGEEPRQHSMALEHFSVQRFGEQWRNAVRRIAAASIAARRP